MWIIVTRNIMHLAKPGPGNVLGWPKKKPKNKSEKRIGRRNTTELWIFRPSWVIEGKIKGIFMRPW